MRADRDANPATPEGGLAGESGLHLPFGITVFGIEELGGHCAAGVSHVLSILDPDWPVPEAFGSFGEHRKLELRFHDVIEDGIAGMRPPAAADIAAMIIDSRAMPFIVVQDERIVLANPAVSAMFRTPGSMVGRRLADLFVASGDRPAAPPPATPGAMRVIWSGHAARADGTSFEIELHVAAESLHGDAALCMFAENVTPRLLSEQQLSSLAYSDALTGVANRARLLDRLRDAVALADADETSLAVLMADLDELKHVNDTWGHQTGDVLLQVMAQRFGELIRDTDTLARLGGEEFCVLVPRIGARGDAEAISVSTTTLLPVIRQRGLRHRVGAGASEHVHP